MRLILTLKATPELVLPIHYNQLVQGFLYRHLEEHLATQLHEEGLPDGKRKLKFFTFSRVMGKFRLERKAGLIRFLAPARLVVSSPMRPFLESLVGRLMTERRLRLGAQEVQLADVEVARQPRFQPPMRVRALSPITVYSTLTTAEGRKKTYYYNPSESEFEAQLLSNLERKARVWYGEALPLDGASIRPVRVSKRDERIVMFKGTVVKGWTGLYALHLPPPYLWLAYEAGLGSKNSQGFGCVEIGNRRL